MFKRLIILAVILAGCSLVNIERGGTLQKSTGKLPEDKELSFKSKEALATGATLQNVTANKVYYEGTEPKSESAKILLDLSYRFMGLVGINMDFDPSDPESVEKVFQEADKALEEKDKNIHDLKVQVDDLKTRMAEEANYHKKEVEKHRSLAGTLWRVIWSIIGIIAGVFVIAGLIQVFTGIPLLSNLLPWVSKRIHSTAKQTVEGVQEIREELKKRAKNGDNEITAEEALKLFDMTLEKHQDKGVKAHVRKLKEAI